MKQDKKKQDKTIIYTIAAVFIILFSILIGYMIYFTIFEEKKIAVHPQNTRLNSLENEVIRGNIYDRTTEVLLATTDEEGRRVYPYGSMYAHPIGYAQSGKTGVEALANQQLLYPNYSLLSLFRVAFMNEKFEGRDIVLTIDHRYQVAIDKAMSGKKGGIVVMEASTGKIRAMYSSPNYDPNQILQNWNVLNTDTENTPLVNRATKGLYPPGSIFKIVTTLAYIQSNEGKPLDFTHDCTGSISGEHFKINCFNQRVHGELDLGEAFAKSCNTYFVALSQQLPKGALTQAALSLGFNETLDFDMECYKSSFKLQEGDVTSSGKNKEAIEESTAYEKAATAIGQGKTRVTPLHMAMIASAIVNDGISMKPYIIDCSMSNGHVKYNNMPKQEGALLDEETAQMLQALMEDVLDHGTAISLPEKGLVVGGKTGTAENETEADHSWFMGYAKDPKNNKPAIAFAIVVEGGGQGAQALDVADKILDAYRGMND